ncbi:hypothetical protein [Edaphobacter aggregans]
MQIGYMRVSKAHGSQSTDLQRRATGRDLRHLINVVHDLSAR